MTDFSQTQRDLIALRTKHGPLSAIGYHCSNIVVLLQEFAKSDNRDQKALLAANIQKQNARLAELLAAARH